MDLEKLKNILKDYPSFRLKQAFEIIFKDLKESWDQATTLPKDLREILNNECPLTINAKILKSNDNSSYKALITFNDDLSCETVLMKHKDIRNTVCVSSQIGCPVNCDFCATGKMGFIRNLSESEIVSQVLLFERILRKENERVTNIVFMGMGEPMLNYDSVMSAIRTINEYLKIGARHISISTSGIIPGIIKLIEEPMQINLALSLHAPSDALRTKIMPINKTYNLIEVLDAIKKYSQTTNRKVMIEYVMLKNVNDSLDDAAELRDLLTENLGQKKLFMVNLISFNETGKYFSSLPEQIKKFKYVLEEAGINVVQRYKFGREIKGACGQLAGINASS